MEHRDQIQGIYRTEGSATWDMKHRDQVQGYMEHKGQIQVIWSTGI